MHVVVWVNIACSLNCFEWSVRLEESSVREMTIRFQDDSVRTTLKFKDKLNLHEYKNTVTKEQLQSLLH